MVGEFLRPPLSSQEVEVDLDRAQEPGLVHLFPEVELIARPGREHFEIGSFVHLVSTELGDGLLDRGGLKNAERDDRGAREERGVTLSGSLSSQLWAERADTANLIGAELGNLRERLQAAGLEVGELACSQGLPPQGPKTTLEQRWVDETA